MAMTSDHLCYTPYILHSKLYVGLRAGPCGMAWAAPRRLAMCTLLP